MAWVVGAGKVTVLEVDPIRNNLNVSRLLTVIVYNLVGHPFHNFSNMMVAIGTL